MDGHALRAIVNGAVHGDSALVPADQLIAASRRDHPPFSPWHPCGDARQQPGSPTNTPARRARRCTSTPLLADVRATGVQALFPPAGISGVGFVLVHTFEGVKGDQAQEPRRRSGACTAVRGTRTGRSRARHIRRGLLLGCGGGLPPDPRGAADCRRLHRRPRPGPQLRTGLPAPHRSCRGGRGVVRPGPGHATRNCSRRSGGPTIRPPATGRASISAASTARRSFTMTLASRKSRSRHATPSSNRADGRSSLRSPRHPPSTGPRNTTSVTSRSMATPAAQPPSGELTTVGPAQRPSVICPPRHRPRSQRQSQPQRHRPTLVRDRPEQSRTRPAKPRRPAGSGLQHPARRDRRRRCCRERTSAWMALRRPGQGCRSLGRLLLTITLAAPGDRVAAPRPPRATGQTTQTAVRPGAARPGVSPQRRAGLPGTDGHRPRGGYQARAPIRADSEGLESHAA